MKNLKKKHDNYTSMSEPSFTWAVASSVVLGDMLVYSDISYRETIVSWLMTLWLSAWHDHTLQYIDFLSQFISP